VQEKGAFFRGDCPSFFKKRSFKFKSTHRWRSELSSGVKHVQEIESKGIVIFGSAIDRPSTME
jgi:hypothetical protein